MQKCPSSTGDNLIHHGIVSPALIIPLHWYANLWFHVTFYCHLQSTIMPILIYAVLSQKWQIWGMISRTYLEFEFLFLFLIKVIGRQVHVWLLWQTIVTIIGGTKLTYQVMFDQIKFSCYKLPRINHYKAATAQPLLMKLQLFNSRPSSTGTVGHKTAGDLEYSSITHNSVMYFHRRKNSFFWNKIMRSKDSLWFSWEMIRRFSKTLRYFQLHWFHDHNDEWKRW